MRVVGFRRGVATAHSVNSQTFEHLVLKGSESSVWTTPDRRSACVGSPAYSVPAVRSYGTMTLIDARLTGRGNATNIPAVINFNGGRMLLRDVTTSGYRRALGDVATPDFAAAFQIAGPGKGGKPRSGHR